MENKTTSNSSIFIITDSILNLISAFADIIALLVCFTFLCAIIYRHIRIICNHGKTTMDVPLILAINTICIIIIKSTMQIIHVTIPTAKKDFQKITDFEETPLDQIRGYTLYSMVGVLYWSYVLLAFFRFIRVIYPKYVCLYRPPLYLYVLIPAQYICVFISMLPLIISFDGIHLIPNEAYCSILIEPFYVMLYASLITFFVPCMTMSMFYVFITRKIRQASAIRPYQERNRRDFVVIRRMVLNMTILCIVSIPYLVIYIIDLIHNNFDSIIYRVQWLSSSMGSFLFSIILPLITTRLHEVLKRNKLKPIVNQTRLQGNTILT